MTPGTRRVAPGPEPGHGATRDAARGLHAWTLRRRVATLAVGLSSTVVIAWLWAALAFHSLHATLADQATRIQPARSAAELIESAVLSENLAERGFLITHQAASLAPFEEGVRTVRRERARLPDLLAGLPELHRALDRTLALADAWRTQVAEEEIALAKSGLSADAVHARVQAGPPFDSVLATFPALDRALTRTDAAATAQVSRTTGTVATIFFLAGLATFLAAITAVLLVGRWMTRPILALHEDINRVAGGDLGHEITATGPPELRRVSADAEAMRRRIVDELDRLRSAQEEIARQADELRRSNRDLEQFAYVASHDLQEPLRKVASFCELIERRYGDVLDERGRQYARLAADGARRMQALIRDVLALARIGRLEDNLAEVDLDACLARAAADVSLELETAKATVTSSGLPTLRADPGLMSALFQNLLTNAVKFRSPDAEPLIEVRAWQSEAGYELSFADNGIGIDPAYADRVFEMFQRLHRRDEYAGTGIGLALCRRIVEHHGGRIWLDTTHSPGACFRWTLPRPATGAAPGPGEGGRGEGTEDG